MTIDHPVAQRSLRGPRPAGPTPRARNSVTHQAALAWRLTARDRWILAMVHEHRVLTTDQVNAMAFPSDRSGRQRLRELHLWSALDRFQPYLTRGSAPFHYVLGPAGATVLAAEHGLDPTALGYRRERVNAIAHSLRLAHTVGINNWFATLISAAGLASATSAPSRAGVAAWWSETRCSRHFGDLVRPDAYGRITRAGQALEFFLEYDLGTTAAARLAVKLSGYAALAAATGIITPLLMWLPTTRRETAARTVLHRALAELDDPRTLPLATAAADLLDPPTPGHVPSPADRVWLPLTPGPGSGSGRVELHRLADIWTHLPPPTPILTDSPGHPVGGDLGTGLSGDVAGDVAGDLGGDLGGEPGRLPPPAPMPPPAGQRAGQPG